MSSPTTPPPLPAPDPLPPPSGQWSHAANTSEPEPRSKTWMWIAIGAGGCFLLLIGIGIAATLFVPAALRGFKRAQHTKAVVEMRDLSEALDTYAAAHRGAYPDSLEALVAPDVQGHTILRDERELPLDPWGRAYVYTPPDGANARPTLLSYGKDGRPGGTGEDEDIHWEDAPEGGR